MNQIANNMPLHVCSTLNPANASELQGFMLGNITSAETRGFPHVPLANSIAFQPTLFHIHASSLLPSPIEPEPRRLQPTQSFPRRHVPPPIRICEILQQDPHFAQVSAPVLHYT